MAIKSQRKDIENSLINTIAAALGPHRGTVVPGRHRIREHLEIKNLFTVPSDITKVSGKRSRSSISDIIHGWEFYRTDQEAMRTGERGIPTNHVWIEHTYQLFGFYTYAQSANSEDKFNDAVDAVSNALNSLIRLEDGPYLLMLRATTPIDFGLEEIAGTLCHTASLTVAFVEDLIVDEEEE